MLSGRQEHNAKMEIKIKNILNNAPSVVNDYSYSFQNKTATTKYNYILHVIEFINFLNGKSITEVKPFDVDKYMEFIKKNKNGKENQASIRATKLFAISNFYNFLERNGYVDKNPCKNTEIPKDKIEKEIISLDIDEIKSIKKNIINGCGSKKANAFREDWKFRDLAIVVLGCTTGMRVAEIVEINIEDIDFDNNTIISTGKGNKTRTIYFGDSTKECLYDWMTKRCELIGNTNNTGALFISNRRERMSVRSVERMIAKYTQNISKHITPHKMRSTCATNLLEQTGNIYLVQKQLGHENIETTKRYAKVSDASRRNAANILDAIF